MEENLSVKCMRCSFNPNVNEEVAKYSRLIGLAGAGFIHAWTTKASVPCEGARQDDHTKGISVSRTFIIAK